MITPGQKLMSLNLYTYMYTLLNVFIVDGDWCAWGEYSPCLPHDTGEFKLKTRQCRCPAPESGGQLCPGKPNTASHKQANMTPDISAELSCQNSNPGVYRIFTPCIVVFSPTRNGLTNIGINLGNYI